MMRIMQHTVTNALFGLELSGVPGGSPHGVTDGIYDGWCADEDIPLFFFVWYEVDIYSSYDAGLPAGLQDDDWDMVNYVLNNKHPMAHDVDIQQAISFFVGTEVPPFTGWAQSMVVDALANGEGFFPSSGDLIGVSLDPAPGVQPTIIEVVLP